MKSNKIDPIEVKGTPKRRVKRNRFSKENYVSLILLATVFLLVLYLIPTRDIKELDTPHYEMYVAEINGVETVIYEDEEGNKSARVQYEYCEPLNFIDNCRIDSRIINIDLDLK